MTAFGEAAQTALELARERHRAITNADFESYESLGDRLEVACSVLDALPSSDPERAVFNELAAIETASLRELQSQAADVSERLSELASQARIHRAYGSSERFSVNGL